MGRGRDFREPRRRGFDDDDFAPPRRSGFGGPPPSFAAQPRTPVASGPPLGATVKWFNPEKGFGFVALDDGTGDAFLHAAVLERSGHSAVQPGATLQVRVGQGQKGPQVTEVLSVDESTATPQAPRPRGPGMGYGAPRTGGGPRMPLGDAVQMTGTMKWYNPEKGFGFAVVEGGGKDVFVHASVLQRAGLATLAEGQRVTMDVAEGRKGPEAVAVRLAD